MINEANKKKVAIVGFGGMGNHHSEYIKDSSRLECIGAFDIKSDRMELAAGKGLKNYSSFEEVLNDDEIEIVLIATPNDLHKDMAIKALESGKNVVCEKPVTLNSDELEEIIACAKRTGKIFTVNQNRRWDEDYLIAKKIYEENICGDIFSIESRVHGSRGIPGDWRGKKQHGGGMLLDWGVHILDQLLMMIPEKVKTVYAKHYYVTNPEVEDGFKITLTFESGLTAMTEVGTTNFISLPRWYLQGINATAVVEDFSCKGKICGYVNDDGKDAVPVKTAAGLTKTMAPRSEESVSEIDLPKVSSNYMEFYTNVADVIDGKANSLIKHEELLRCMRLMEACFVSDDEKRVVNFE